MGRYEPAVKCTAGPTAGAKALMAWYLGAYAHLGAKNLGIYNCRTIEGSTALSLHAEGRAPDLGAPKSARYLATLCEKLRLHSAELEIQLIIYRRHVWSSRRPLDGWRVYEGSNPHDDHAHVELTWAGAKNLTVARLNAVLSEGAQTPHFTEEIMDELPQLRKGATGPAVVRLQALLNTTIFAPAPQLTEDGAFGDKTEAMVRSFQETGAVRNSVSNGVGDGIVGRYTWAELLGVEIA